MMSKSLNNRKEFKASIDGEVHGGKRAPPNLPAEPPGMIGEHLEFTLKHLEESYGSSRKDPLWVGGKIYETVKEE